MTGDELIARLRVLEEARRLSDQEFGDVLNELLGLSFTGFPVERLGLLLGSDDSTAKARGAMASKRVARTGGPLAPALVVLLGQRGAEWGLARMAASYLCKFEALDAAITRQLLELLPERSDLRYESDAEVVHAAIRGSPKTAKRGARRPHKYGRERPVARLLIWMLRVENATDQVKQIEARLTKGDTIDSVFAAAAAARCRQDSIEPLTAAAASPIPAVQDFARTELGWGQRGQRRWNLGADR